jgi:uncharacterized membrane protein
MRRFRLPFAVDRVGGITAVLLLTAWVRLARLTWYSLDVDEAFSLYWARTPLTTLLPELFSLRGDPHPPVYYGLLKIWLALLGENEVGLRLFSALTGVLFVALLYRLARTMFRPPVGLAAAVLAIFNPALVYASLDARMYMPTAVLVLAGALALWWAMQRGGWHRFTLAFVCLALAAYSHLGGILAVVTLCAAVIALAGKGDKRLGAAALALGGVGLVYAPYGLNVWRASGVSGGVITRSAPTVTELVRVTAEYSLFHQTVPPDWLLVAGMALLLTAVLWGLILTRERLPARLWLAAMLLLPLLLLVLLSQRQALLQPKMLVITTVAPLLLAAALPARAWLVGLLLLPQLWGYAAMWQPHWQRENWRAAGQYLATHAGPADVTVAHLHFYEEPLRFYYRGQVVTPFGSHLTDAAEVENGLLPYLDAEVLWLAQSGTEYTDPERLLERWLADRYPLVTEQYPQHIRLKGFLLRATGLPPLPGSVAMAVPFADGRRLGAFWLNSRALPARDQWLHPPSNWLHLVLYATPGDYTITLEDGPGNVWAGTLPRHGPPPAVAPGEIGRFDYDLNLNPETPPGIYKVVLRATGPDGYVPRADNGENYLILDLVEIMADD